MDVQRNNPYTSTQKSTRTNSDTNAHYNANSGKHFIAEFYHCQCDKQILCQAEEALLAIKNKVQVLGLTVVGEVSHQFTDLSQKPQNTQSSGFTLSLLLAESHICLHTWGEFDTVTLDVYVCNYLQDNSQKAAELLNFCKDLFKPSRYDIKDINRFHAVTSVEV